MQKPLVCALALCSVLVLAPHAGAEEISTYPRLRGTVAVEIQNDTAVRSDDADAEFNDLFTKTEPTLALEFTPEIAIRAGLVLQPVAEPRPGEDRFFADHGLFVEELVLVWEGRRAALHGGKFTPNFGIAWDAAPGIYGTDTAEDYELSERIGLGGRISFGGEESGEHRLSASLFFLDTSLLADSYPRGRGNTSRSDGGPSNTESLVSFALALDGEIAAAPGLAYHLAIVDQAKGAGGGRDEWGLVGAATYEAELAGGWTLAPLLEVAHFEDFANLAGQTRTYVTAAVEIGRDNWSGAAAYTGRIARGPAGDADDFQVQLSVGYAFASGFAVQIGWKHGREARVDTDTIGVLLSYAFGF